jgi:hypothetical protein
VGGDFFQILPAQHGGVILVIGDVSGKDMPAAMTVSLLVGTVRGQVLVDHEPRLLHRCFPVRKMTAHFFAGGFERAVKTKRRGASRTLPVIRAVPLVCGTQNRLRALDNLYILSRDRRVGV